VVVGAGPVGEPAVDVALGAGGQGGAVVAEPVDQGDGGADLSACAACLAVREIAPFGAGAELVEGVPASEGADNPAFVRVVDVDGDLGDPPFEPSDALVAWGQNSAGDEHRT
jgi:hypothetical protein